MAIQTGVNATELAAYIAAMAAKGVSVTELDAYIALMAVRGVSVTQTDAWIAIQVIQGVSITEVYAYVALMGVNVSAPVWPSFSFVAGTIGIAYSQNWDLYPAAAPTTYTLVSGALPTGLALSDVSDDMGLLSGMPTAVGTYTFVLRATNTYGTADKSFALTINAPGGQGRGGGTFF